VSSAGPTLCFDHLTPAQVRAFRIADNRLTEISVRDDRLLAEQLKELLLLGLDSNIEAAGFDKGEIGFRIASLEGPSEADDELAFAAPAPCSLCLDRHCARRCVKRQVGTKDGRFRSKARLYREIPKWERNPKMGDRVRAMKSESTASQYCR
jgi:hypothetical protein